MVYLQRGFSLYPRLSMISSHVRSKVRTTSIEVKKVEISLLKATEVILGWLQALRENNTDIKIVPRFIIEGDQKIFQLFLSKEQAINECADAIARFLQV